MTTAIILPSRASAYISAYNTFDQGNKEDKQEEAEGVLVAFHWPSRIWFLDLVLLGYMPPLLDTKNLLTQDCILAQG